MEAVAVRLLSPTYLQEGGRHLNQDVILEMKGISKAFPGVQALDKVDLTVRKGTVHALMGENGAGNHSNEMSLRRLRKG